MIDDSEVPTPRPEDPGSGAQYDEHGRRQEESRDRPVDFGDVPQHSRREAEYLNKLQQLTKENPGVTKWNEDFLGNWEYYFSEHFEPKDVSIINALFSVESFDEYVGLVKDRIIGKMRESDISASKEEVSKKVSEALEKEVVLKISELYISVDKNRPDETFEDLINANFMKSVKTSYEIIKNKLTQLEKKLARISKTGELPENLKNLLFFKKVSVEELKEVEVSHKKGDKDIVSSSYSTRPYPIAVSKESSISDFVHYVESQADHYMNLRKYLHNATVIFKRGKGEHGFYAGLAEYAKQLSNSDIDSFMLLPDSDLFMAAHNLYIKHLTNFFARHDWIHQPGTFSTDFFEVNTEVEESVMEDLKKIFPNIKNNEDWRLQRALKLGVGISRAVTLSEVEIAAYADPAVKAGKTPKDVTFESYYISDSAALTAFRPSSNIERFWPPDIARGPLLFSPVSGFTKDRTWDHNKLWKKMKQWQESYINGNDFEGSKKEEMLMIDALQNIGKVGALEFRSGWRFQRGYESWLKFIGKTGNVDMLESWKQIENIGYLILKNFGEDKIIHGDKDFLTGGKDGSRIAERDAFFEYLNEKYINFNPMTGEVNTSLSTEIAEIRNKNKGISNEKLYKYLLSKAYFGSLRNRIPTYFIRLDRTRFTKDGIRAYEEIRRNFGEGWDNVRMDSAMRSLSDVETGLRIDVSGQMKKQLASTPDGKNLANPNIKYILNEQYIRSYLGEMLKDSGNVSSQIEDAVKLYKYINEKYLNNSDFANEKINMLNDGKFPYTLAVEEHDRSFVAYRGSGDTPLYRALNDTAQIEQKVSEQVASYIESLRDISIDPKHDMGPLIKTLSEMRTQISILHGDATAWKQTSYLVGMTINYFRKDSQGKGILGFVNMDRKNSIAAEVVGTHRGVWEWENPEIHKFIVECERQGIIPKDHHELKTPQEYEEKSFFGIKYKKIKENAEVITGQDARKKFGATYGDITKDIMFRYLPIIFLFYIWRMLSAAAKEESGNKQ